MALWTASAETDTHATTEELLEAVFSMQSIPGIEPNSARELHVALKIPYVCDYTTYRTQVEVILNHVNPNIRGTGQGEARHKKYKRLELGGGQACDRSAE
jgi:hypothetical protein